MAFWMDCSGVGDRGTVGITSLLTQLFLVGSINEAMPPVSYVKAADEFLIASFAFTFFALLESIVVYKTAASERHKDKGTLFKNKVINHDLWLIFTNQTMFSKNWDNQTN